MFGKDRKNFYAGLGFFILAIAGLILSGDRWYLKKAEQKMETGSAGTGDMNTNDSAQDTLPVLALQDSLDMENLQKAGELTQAATLRLNVEGKEENWSGTAFIWDQTEEEVILATSAHLLEKGQENLIVIFESTEEENRKPVLCQVIGISGELDLGFVSFQKGQVQAEVLENLRMVRLHQRTYDTLCAGDMCFATGSSTEGTADLYQELVWVPDDLYEEEIGDGLFLMEGTCAAGMSGSGVFDGYGHLIGMVVAADESRTLAIPMDRINEAYKEVTGRIRDTRDYGG